MIKIDRDSLPPYDIYVKGPNKGLQKWRCAELKVMKLARNNKKKLLSSDYSFPKHPSYNNWKKELIKCQGKKCCYCGKPISEGQIEHYRPKKGWQQKVGDTLISPGYYWLTYRWSNLLLSCAECNASGQKGNLFPIQGIRADTHSANLDAEDPLFINPYDDDVSKSISYYKSSIVSKDDRGRVTIDALKLNTRADLNRDDKFAYYKQCYKIAALSKPFEFITQNDINEAKELLVKAKRKKVPFSGMILENIQSNGFDDY